MAVTLPSFSSLFLFLILFSSFFFLLFFFTFYQHIFREQHETYVHQLMSSIYLRSTYFAVFHYSKILLVLLFIYFLFVLNYLFVYFTEFFFYSEFERKLANKKKKKREIPETIVFVNRSVYKVNFF